MRPTIFNYLPTSDATAIYKLAEGDSEMKSKAKSVLKGIAGIGLGTAAGYGIGHAADAVTRHYTGKPIPQRSLLTAAPIIGGGLGLMYNLARAHQDKELNSASKDSHNGGERSLPTG